MIAINFKYNVPLKDTMVFEPVYHRNLQLDLNEKQELRNTPGAVFVWMFVGKEIVGESYGFPIALFVDSIKGLSGLTDIEKSTGIYCYSNTILPSFQRKGFGRVLKAHWLGVAAGKGFQIVYGHARQGGSQALNAEFGVSFVGSFPDWYGTGEEYKMYRLILDGTGLI